MHIDLDELDEAGECVVRAHQQMWGQDLEPSATVGLHVLEAEVARRRGDPALALELLGQQASGWMLVSERAVVSARAQALGDLGRYDEALEAAAASLLAKGEDAWSAIEARRVRGDLLARTGHRDAAVESWTEALDLVKLTGLEGLRRYLEARLA